MFILTSLILIFSSSSLSSLVLCWILFLALIFLIKDNKSLILFSFLTGVIFMVVVYHYWTILYGNSYFLGVMSDDWQYDVLWTEGYISVYGISTHGLYNHLNSIQKSLGILHNSKTYVMVVIYLRYFATFFDGYHTFLPRILNIFLLALTAYYGSLIAFRNSNSTKIRKMTFLSIFFFPVLIFNSSHIFRDTLISFILVYTCYISLTNKYSYTSIIKIILLFFMLLNLRSSTFFIGLLMLTINYSNTTKINLKLLFVTSIFLVFIFTYFPTFIDVGFSQYEAYNTLNTKRFGIIGSSIFNLPIYVGLIPRIIYLIFTPVPNFSGIHQLFLSISALLQVFYFPYFIYSFKNLRIDVKLKLTFLLFFLGVAITSADFRHVMMYLPFGIILTIISYGSLVRTGFSNKIYYRLLFLLFLFFFLSIGLGLIF